MEQLKPLSRSRKLLWLEIAVVLATGFLLVAFAQLLGQMPPMTYAFLAYDAAHTLAAGAVILFIVWVADGSLRTLGINKPRPTDLVLASFLCLSLVLADGLVATAIPESVHQQWESAYPIESVYEQLWGDLPLWPILISLLIINTFEEILMRGYLVSRLVEVTSTRWIPVVVSSGLFALWHCYQGPLGVIGAFIMGLILAIAFLRVRRIAPLILAHFAYNTFVLIQYSNPN